MDKKTLIKQLGLEKHPFEEGYFRRTYESQLAFGESDNQRKLLTSIYYLLTDDSPIGCLHKNRSDIVHYFHLGAPIKYFIISASGELRQQIMGHDIQAGHQLQLTVKGGEWKASQLLAGEFGLVSEAVAPGFDYQDNEIARKEQFSQQFPDLVAQVKHLFHA